jgi:hypothetical protein
MAASTRSRKRTPRGTSKEIAFSNEELLREALRGLLMRMPDVRVPEIAHGRLERGKDLIFELPGGLGRSLLCAAVVKNTPINASASHRDGAPTVLNQVRQALTIPVLQGDGSERCPDRVFVVTPFPVSQEAIHSVVGQLRDRANNVEFIGGPKLNELFREHWADFVFDEYTAIRNYVKQVAAGLNEDETLKRMAQQYRVTAPSRSVGKYYVQPRFNLFLHAYSIDQYCRSLTFDEFSFLHERFTKVVDGEKKEFTRKVDPQRLILKKSDPAAAEAATARLKQILPILVEWEYCAAELSHSIEVDATAYSQRLQRLRDDAIKSGVRSIDSPPLADLRLRANPVELTAKATDEVLREVEGLRKIVDQAFSTLRADIGRANELMNDRRVEGARVLQHRDFACCTKLEAISEAFPSNSLTSTARRVVQFSERLLDKVKTSVLVVGPAGYGKTTFCRWNALNDAERFYADSAAYLPVYVPLYEVSTGLQSFEKTFLSHVGRSALVPEGVAREFKEGRVKVRLYLDGLDEVPHPDVRRGLVNLAKKGAAIRKNVQVVVTARDYITGPFLEWLPRCHLSDFEPEQIKRLSRKWLSPADYALFEEQVSRTPSIVSVMRIPLLATLTLLVFRQRKNLMSSRTSLYQAFVDLLNDGWDLVKQVHRDSDFGAMVKSTVLQRLALRCHTSRTRKSTERDFAIVVDACLKAASSSARKALLQEVLRDGLLVRSGSDLSFAHLSFQEFMAAKCLIGEPKGKRATHVLKDYLRGDDWWLEVLRFYIGLSAKPQDLTSWLTDTENSLPKKQRHEQTVSQIGKLLAEVRTAFPTLADS